MFTLMKTNRIRKNPSNILLQYQRNHQAERRAKMAPSKAQSPPYPSAARIADSECYPAYAESLKCLEVFNSEKSKCQKHFDIYKECKKKEREARLERNRSRSLFS